MAPSTKDRRKSDKAEKPAEPSEDSSGLVLIKVSPERLRALLEPPAPATKESTPAKESPATSTTLPAPNTENVSESTPNTPPASDTPASASVMGPPADGPKKKGVKRSSAALNGNGDGAPKPRGKPGPKKKQRLDDGTIDHARPSGGAKLGPKANQGAINAGLRALDRSGKPCRKWAKGSFKLKSFTGVMWEIPRWTAPPRPTPELTPENSATASAEGSNKENKDNENENDKASPKIKSDKSNSNSGGDVDITSAIQSAVPSIGPSSPAPVAIAAAS